MTVWHGIGGAALVACCTTFLMCYLLVRTQHLHGRFTHDGMRGVQKFHTRPTPRIGGLAVAIGYCAVWPVLPSDLAGVWALVGLAGLPALGAGLAEDLTKRVGVRIRLGATMIAGVIFALSTGYVMDRVDLPGIDWLLGFSLAGLLFTGFAMGGVANAVNIIDGFNGLAAGALIIMFAAFAFVAAQVGDSLVFELSILFGALMLGFFALNFPYGTIFLGDGGAYFCGFLLAVLGVLLPVRNPEISAWAALLICGYPVIETLASMQRKRKRAGHSVGQPDRVHFHMLAHRRYARRLVPRRGADLRNPATSLVTWVLPMLTTAFVAISYDSAVLSAVFFFLTAFLYAQLYRLMSLNAPRLSARFAGIL